MKNKKLKLTDEEKMVKRFKDYTDFIQIIEVLLIFVIISLLIIVVTDCINYNFNITLVKNSILGVLNYDGAIPEIVFLIIKSVEFISFIILIHNLGKIMKETYEKKTPFIETNIRRINIIAICAIFATNIIFFLIMLAIKELFKYGYKLQIESDETL